MILVVLLVIAALQDVSQETVVERVQLTAEESEAVSLLLNAGREARRCEAHLPSETRAAFRSGAARIPTDPGILLEGPPPSLPDVAFLAPFQQEAEAAGREPSASECERLLADARLLLEGRKNVIESLIDTRFASTDRPWERIGQAAVDSGLEARRRPALATSAGSRTGGAVRTGPRWAEAPRVAIPAAAREARRAGWARIECVVTTRGRARDCRLVAESAEGFGFGEAALRAEERYRFQPGEADGEPIETRGVFTVQFRL